MDDSRYADLDDLELEAEDISERCQGSSPSSVLELSLLP
jgi:hypothetical protein